MKRLKTQKEGQLQDNYKQVLEQVDNKTKRALILAQEKGSGARLTDLPIKSLRYTLNKKKFRESISSTYDWKIHNTPSDCNYETKNDVHRALSYKIGGYVTRGQN